MVTCITIVRCIVYNQSYLCLKGCAQEDAECSDGRKGRGATRKSVTTSTRMHKHTHYSHHQTPSTVTQKAIQNVLQFVVIMDDLKRMDSANSFSRSISSLGGSML